MKLNFDSANLTRTATWFAQAHPSYSNMEQDAVEDFLKSRADKVMAEKYREDDVGKVIAETDTLWTAYRGVYFVHKYIEKSGHVERVILNESELSDKSELYIDFYVRMGRDYNE